RATYSLTSLAASHANGVTCATARRWGAGTAYILLPAVRPARRARACVAAHLPGRRWAMTRFGYTMMCEQSPPDQLVRDLQKAEAAGFEFSVISDHYQPWLEEQGHS